MGDCCWVPLLACPAVGEALLGKPAVAPGESTTVVFANVFISLREMKAYLAERDEYTY
jgi:hypothetical protein